MNIRVCKRIARMVLRPLLFHKNISMRPDGNSRNGLLALLQKLSEYKTPIVMAEIGSYKGESAEIFISSGIVSRLYCVDPWKPFYDDDDGAAFTNMRKVEEEFNSRHGDDPRVVKIKGTIDDLVATVEESGLKLDFVYIDGCHTYDAVRYDLEVTFEKLKHAVAVGGHDYCEDGNGVFPGAGKAVREIVGRPDVVFKDTSWIKFNSLPEVIA